MKRFASWMCCIGLISIFFAACNTDFPVGHGGGNGKDTTGIDTIKHPLPDTTLPDTTQNDTTITDTLPAAMLDFLNTHFPNYSYNIRFDGQYYHVAINSMPILIVFAADGTWLKIEGHAVALPESVVKLLPQETRNYIQTNYNGWVVIGIENGNAGDFIWRMKLMKNGRIIELEFDKYGMFIRVNGENNPGGNDTIKINPIEEFIVIHFPKYPFQIIYSTDGNGITGGVAIDSVNEIHIIFNKYYEWDVIEGKDLPFSLLDLFPRKALEYITQTYSSFVIKRVTNGKIRDIWEITIVLPDGTKTHLKFNQQGDLIP